MFQKQSLPPKLTDCCDQLVAGLLLIPDGLQASDQLETSHHVPKHSNHLKLDFLAKTAAPIKSDSVSFDFNSLA